MRATAVKEACRATFVFDNNSTDDIRHGEGPMRNEFRNLERVRENLNPKWRFEKYYAVGVADESVRSWGLRLR